MTVKKMRERRVVAQLRGLWPDFPAGEIQDGESPDFTVETSDGARIGIEVTAYHRPRQGDRALLVEQESLRWRVAERVAAGLNEAKVPAIRVSLFFNDIYPLNKGAVSPVAHSVLGLSLSRAAALRVDEGDKIDFRPRELPREVSRLHVSRLSGLTESSCVPAGATSVPTLGIAEVQNLVNKKAAKVGAYKIRCTSVILIIEIHGFRLTSIANLAESVLSYRFVSPFANTFVLIDGQQLVELQRA
jgi:hypothetical protein